MEGKEETVGVDGRTLTEVCGERVVLENGTDEWIELAVDDVDEALEWLGRWCMLRMEETDEDVDLRPRRPPVTEECR